MKILFLVPYPLQEAPSQRFRFEQYFKILKNQGYSLKVQSFLLSNNWQLFYSAGHPLKKFLALIGGFLKRFYALLIAPFYDYVFIHREAAPLGPPVFEWLIGKVLRKKIIYDFDDAIWLSDREHESRILKILKWRSKVQDICRWSYKVSCGNQYLTQYALRFNSRAITNPTTIDCENLHNAGKYESKESSVEIIIGWTGSHSTLKYLQLIEPVLQKLEDQFSYVSFLAIADKAPSIRLKRLSFNRWNPKTEIEDLIKIDIGIMPLPNAEWTKGKCGFKALQYMSLCIPAVASPVGVSTIIINHDINGYICESDDEWLKVLAQLIQNVELRKRIGSEGRKKVIRSYSLESNVSNFLSLFS